MGQRHVCTFRHAQRAAYRTAISAAQTCCNCVVRVRIAVHHNNCMYIAHHLITIDKVFQQRATDGSATVSPPGYPPLASSWPPAPGHAVGPAPGPGPGVPHGGLKRPGPGPGGGGGVSDGGKLMDVVAWTKRLGNDSFTQHVSVKKQQLSDHLRTAKGRHGSFLLCTNAVFTTIRLRFDGRSTAYQRSLRSQ